MPRQKQCMTNSLLVEHLVQQGLLRTPAVISAFKQVDRADFVPLELRGQAYDDAPLSIGSGQTISAPHMVAVMTEALNVQPFDKVLEIGTGSGYQASVLSRLAHKGVVFTTENADVLARQAQKRLSRFKNVRVITADGSLGLPQHAPFDRILATCACPEIPRQWIEQLALGGLIVAPVGSPHEQDLVLLEKQKTSGKTITRSLNFPCVFVPMRGKHGFS